MPVITARAPTRLDFGGGWTDVPPYSYEVGGFVCNLAISRYATVSAERHAGSGEASTLASDEGALASAVMRRLGARQVRVRQTNDFPVKAGLGGSSAAGVAMLAAMLSVSSRAEASEADFALDLAALDRSALAEASRQVEVEDLGIAGGRQDHYAATYGGALALTFDDTTHVRRLSLSQATKDALTSRLVVVYTGESRISRDTITAVLDAYVERKQGVLDALAAMQGLARSMAAALEGGDVESLGVLIGEHWEHQRALHPAITTPRIDEILARARAAGALGGKALGASGGGCVLLVAASERGNEVRRAVAPIGEVVDFAIDDEGVQWWANDSEHIEP